MTFTATAAAMRRVADGIDKAVAQMGHDTDTGKPRPAFEDEQQAVGAALMLVFLRDLVTAGERDVFDRPTLLVLLETTSRDADLFPFGTGTMIWNAEMEDDDDGNY